MDNALVIDGILAAVLAAGAIVGAKRGLFKSLMGLFVVLAALVGAALLADMLSRPITDIIAPKVEEAMVERFAARLDSMLEDGEEDGRGGSLLEALREDGLSPDTIRSIFAPLASSAREVTRTARDTAIETYRTAISGTVRALTGGAVHAALLLALYVILLFVLKMLTKALDHVFDLPVLSAVNGALGAVLGLLEAALLLRVLVYAASRLGVSAIAGHAEDTYILPVFLNHSPVELITSLLR